jgi:hypothetical protein
MMIFLQKEIVQFLSSSFKYHQIGCHGQNTEFRTIVNHTGYLGSNPRYATYFLAINLNSLLPHS